MTDTASLVQLVPGVFILNSTFVESKRGLIIDRDGSILVDTSVSFAETMTMLERAKESESPVRRIILTHSHFDHSAGCQLLPQAERIAGCGAGDWMLSEHAANYLAQRPAEHPDLEGIQITLPTLELEGSAKLRLERRALHMFPTPGHSPDSMSILLEPDGILFTGDAVVTCFPPIIQDGDSGDAVRSLERILELEFTWLVPGHGPVLEARDARRHCQVSLAYLQEVRSRLSRFDDPQAPPEEVSDSVADLRLMLPFSQEIVETWHPRVVVKVWDERRQALLNGSTT